MTIRGPEPNLERIGFNDAASSLVVRDGVRHVCTGARFNGSCVELNPGEYSRVGLGLDDRISSLREVRPSAVIETVPVPIPEAPPMISPRGLSNDAPNYAPGRCRTFGPGDYASLPWELDHVASGRFVPERYSYLR